MKKITWTVFFFVLMSNAIYAAPNITGAEYFIDIDPGEGMANPLTVTTSNCSYTRVCAVVNFNFDTSNLFIGYHLLYIRMKNENNIWGITNKYPFFVEGQKRIVAGEYFIDNDPGLGNANPINIEDNQFMLSKVDTSLLGIGLHNLFVRMKNSDNLWGPLRKQIFEVSPPSTISQSEYFIDYEPGVAKGEQLLSNDGSFDEKIEDIIGTIDTEKLSSGLTHTVFVRAKDNYNRWGHVSKKSFFVKDPIPTISGRVFTTIAGWNNLSIRKAKVSLENTDIVTYTDDNGFFSIKNVSANNYTLIIESSNFETMHKTFTWNAENNIDFDIALRLPKYSDLDCDCEIPYDNGILLYENFDVENGGEGKQNLFTFKNWIVTNGMVDLIGVGYLDGIFDFLPGNGLYLDMDGTRDDNEYVKAGTITSKDKFKLYPGNYLLEFNLAGCQRDDDNTNEVTVSLGDIFSERIDLENYEDFKLFSRTISVTNTAEVHLSFAHSGGDQYGLLLDNIKFLSLNGRNGCGILGDVNNDGVIGLKEAIRALQTITGIER